MKFGMNLCLWTTEVTPQYYPVLRRLKSLGFDGVEIPITPGHGEDFDTLRRLLADEGLECTTLTNLPPDANPVSAEARVRRKGVDALKWAVEMSALLGSRILSGPLYVASNQFTGTGPTSEELERFADVLRLACASAAEADITLCIEFMNRFETYLVNTTADAVALAARGNAPNLALVYDTHHAHLEERNIADAIRGAGGAIKHLHFSESHRGALGTGLVNWQATTAALGEAGFDGWVMIEAFGKDVAPLNTAAHVWRNVFSSKEDVARDGLAFVRRCFPQKDGQ